MSDEDQYYIARNLLAIFQRDYQLVAELHVQSGWVPKDTSILALTSAVRTVCEPIFQRPLNEISLGHILIDLFATARDFKMEVQPALVLLQKTLLNIEGLGRQLYPELDLWQTAKPFLEKWLKERYSPRNILKKVTRNAPDMLEKIATMPAKIDDLLESIEKNQPSKNIRTKSQVPSDSARSGGGWLYLIFGFGIGIIVCYALISMNYL